MADIISLSDKSVSPKVLLQQMLQRNDIEAIVVAVRIDGRWQSHWTSTALGGLAMGVMKLWRDVSDWIEQEPGDG